jgi:hypothetical protein
MAVCVTHQLSIHNVVDTRTTPETHIPEVTEANLVQDTGYPEDFGGFSQSVRASTEIIPLVGHCRFLSHPFQFNIHLLSRHSTPFSLTAESVVARNVPFMVSEF